MINEIKNIEIVMKKILNLIVILFFGLTFAACSDDDEEMSKSPLIGGQSKFNGLKPMALVTILIHSMLMVQVD